MAATPAVRERSAEPYRDEREHERRALRMVARGTRRRRGLALRRRPGVLLIAFAVAVALLAVGRVTLSFAVVQKNMDTEALVREQRALAAENARLQDQLAGLMATPRLRELAITRYGLVPVTAQDTIYLDGSGTGKADTGGTAVTAQTAGAGASGESGSVDGGL
jgi:cell division protein FtsL